MNVTDVLPETSVVNSPSLVGVIAAVTVKALPSAADWKQLIGMYGKGTVSPPSRKDIDTT